MSQMVCSTRDAAHKGERDQEKRSGSTMQCGSYEQTTHARPYVGSTTMGMTIEPYEGIGA